MYHIPTDIIKSKLFSSGDYKKFDKVYFQKGGFYKKGGLFSKDKTIDYIAECDSKISELLGQIDDLSMRQNLDNLIATLRNRTV